MGLESVKTEILAQAEKEAQAILEEAQTKKKEVDNRLKVEIEEYKKQLEEEERLEILQKERIALAKASSDAKHIVLETKKDILDEAFEKAKKKILSSKKNYFDDLLNNAKKQIPVASVVVTSNDKGRVKGLKCTVGNFEGGLIAANKENTVMVDYTYETIFQTLQEKLLATVGAKLFK